jgi:hypothetical protein
MKRLLTALCCLLFAASAPASWMTNWFGQGNGGSNTINVTIKPKPGSTPFILPNGQAIITYSWTVTATNGLLTSNWIDAGTWLASFGPSYDTWTLNVPNDSNCYSLWWLATNVSMFSNANPNVTINNYYGGSSGTVTSVGMAADALGFSSWSGSPVTSGGTFTPTFAKGSHSQFGIFEVDNSTITANGGVLSAVSGSGTVTSITMAGDTSGALTFSPSTITTSGTFTPTMAKANSGQFGVVEVDNSTITASSGVISVGAIPASDITSGTIGAARLPLATSSTVGGVEGDGATININGSGVESVVTSALTKGSSSVFGILEVDNSTITASGGVISVGAIPASDVTSGTIGAARLPLATSSTVGGVEGDGSTISINGSGVESVVTSALTKGSSSVFGIVEVDNSTITASAGVISAVHTGTVTSIGMAQDSGDIFSAWSPTSITTSGTFTPSFSPENANTFFAGPVSGSAAAPQFRSVNTSDIQGLQTYFLNFSSASIHSSTTFYYPLTSVVNLSTGGATETNYGVLLLGPHLLTNFFVNFQTALGAGTNFVWTIRTNGTSTGITVTITSSSSGYVSDTTHYAWITNAVVDVQCVSTMAASGNFFWNWAGNY